ncbi:adenosine kinase [Rhodobacteraceae bacterium NNCM2]|nr:adenosine kinase [Coraliihabitans acroporae]
MSRLDLVAIGNAIVDVIAPVEDSFLEAHGVARGSMSLIDTERAASLYAAMPPSREISGGSAANTVVGAAMIGCSTAYVGKVRDDQLGQIFGHDIRASGVDYQGPVAPADSALETARSFILVSPDGERSMNTYLGISTTLHADDIDTALMARADWLYLEGYLFDMPEAKDAYAKAIEAAKEGGGKIAFTVSDPFCISRHRDDMLSLIRSHVDLLFANEAEVKALMETENLEIALGGVSRLVDCAAVTLGSEGAVILRGDQRTKVAPQAVDVKDTTGAGDLFASGFLAGQIRGHDDRVSAHMGCIAAGEVISHLGARPEADLAELIGNQGF